MRWRIAFCVCVLAFAGASCETPTADDEAEASPSATVESLDADEFTLTGVVVDAKAGAQPAGGLPGEDDLVTSTVGGIAVRPDGPTDTAGLEGCSTTQDAYLTYYTPETDAAGLEDDDTWPETLEGQNVTVEGMRHTPEQADEPDTSADDDEDACVLVVGTVRPATGTAPADDDTGGTAGQTNDDGAATGSPEASGDEGEWVWPSPADFPEHEDTDPIFEGTPSPDPCEGQKACEQHRKTGQEPQP